MNNTQVRDLIDVYVAGLLFEITREIRMDIGDGTITNSAIGEKVEDSVLKFLAHECLLDDAVLLKYISWNQQLNQWYMDNSNRYSDYFLEQLPERLPYIDNPEMYANIWGNLASQMIGAIVGNIREDGI